MPVRRTIRMHLDGRTRKVLIIRDLGDGTTQVAYRYYIDGGLLHVLIPTSEIALPVDPSSNF